MATAPPLPDAVQSAGDHADERWGAVLGRLSHTLVCLDFDGTLAPIVEDPDQARAHPQAGAALQALARQVRAVAVVTGRPVEQVLRLGGLEPVADELGDAGLIEVCGQYGVQRWSSATREVRTPDPPEQLEELRERLPGLLRDAGLGAAYVEDKGLALAVHARRMADPDRATEALRGLLAPVARELGLRLEPGRQVVELRSPGTDKGQAVRQLVEELEPTAVVFAGDDLGDVAGFEAVERFRAAGGEGLLVCSASTEESELVSRADVVVDGPAGVVSLLRTLAAAAS